MNKTLARLAAATALALVPGFAAAQVTGSFDCIARAEAPCAPGVSFAAIAAAAADPSEGLPAVDLLRAPTFEAAGGGVPLALSTGTAPALMAMPAAAVAGAAEVALPSSVPEPSAYVLMLAGLAALGFMARRRRG